MISDWRKQSYLFHVHTRYTDGQFTCADYIRYAKQESIESVIFLEHIRRAPDYNVSQFVREARDQGRSAGVEAVVGFETKLLPDGSLDISDTHLRMASVIGIAEHGFQNDVSVLRSAFVKPLADYPRQWRNITFVWVHPGLWFTKQGRIADSNPTYTEMLTAALACGVLIEKNLRYGIVTKSVATQIGAESLVIGADEHNVRDLERWSSK